MRFFTVFLKKEITTVYFERKKTVDYSLRQQLVKSYFATILMILFLMMMTFAIVLPSVWAMTFACFKAKA